MIESVYSKIIKDNKEIKLIVNNKNVLIQGITIFSELIY